MKFFPYLFLGILLLVLTFNVVFAASSSIGINFEVKDENGNPISNTLIIIQGITNSGFSENKLTDSNGRVSFNLNQNEAFIYVIYKLSYKEQTGSFFTSGNRNFAITLEKIPTDQWFLYLINNGELELRFKVLDNDTNYLPGDHIKPTLEIRNVAGRDVKLIDDKNIFQIIDAKTLNDIAGWGDFELSKQINVEATLKKDGWMRGTLSEDTVEVCAGNVKITYNGNTFDLSGEEFLCLSQAQSYNNIPEWIPKDNYKFEVNYTYEIDGQEKNIGFETQEFFIDGQTTNNAPVITSIPLTIVNENEQYNYQVNTTDVDGDVLTYSLSQSPSWLSVNTNTGLISGIAPSVSLNTDFNVTIDVSDGINITTQNYILTILDILPVNNPPFIVSMPITQVNETQNYSYDIDAIDSDNDTLFYSFSGPGWLSIDSSTGLLSGIAPVVSVDTNFDISTNVSDGIDVRSQDYTLTVINVPTPPTNNPPIANDSNFTMDENTSITITLLATDVDLDSLTYSIVNNPANGVLSNFNSATGTVTYTPNSSFSGQDNFTFNANDGQGGSNIATVSITINQINPPANNPPVIISNPLTQIEEGKNYTYQIIATDLENDTLTYFIIQAPNWLTINSLTGLVSGMAPNVSANTSFNAIIRVSDGKSNVTQNYVLTLIDFPVSEITETRAIGGGSGTRVIPMQEFEEQKYLEQFNLPNVILGDNISSLKTAEEIPLELIILILITLNLILILSIMLATKPVKERYR